MRKFLLVLLTCAIAATGYWGRRVWLRQHALPAGLIQANGRIEGDHVSIASKFAGRIAELQVREGDQVQTGQLLVQLDDKQIRAQVNQARHAVEVSEAQIKQAEAEAAAAAADVQAAQTSLQVLKKQVPLTIARAEAELAHARAVAASADSTEGERRKEYERALKLRASNSVAEEELDQKKLVWTVAANDLTVAHAAVTKAEKQLAEERLGDDRIRERENALLALEARHAKALAAIEECTAGRAQSQAVLQEATSMLDDLAVAAPVDGRIMTRMADQGEVVSAGSPLYDLVNLDRLYLQVYVPETEIGKVRLGLAARIHTDAYPDQPFSASVGYIASEAEFTPKEVQTLDERVKLVYAVRLYLDQNPDHRLTPGLPADAVIRWKDDAPWEKPRW